MKARIRLQGFFIFLALIASVLLYKFICPQYKDQRVDLFLDLLGIGLIFLGFLFRISARGFKANNSLEGKKLVTGGPYGLARHPMYFGTLLIGLGVILVLFQWWTIIIFAIVFLFIYIPQTAKEGRYLSEHFGQEYRDYCKKTPRFFPNIFNFDIRKHLFFKRAWVKKERPSLLAVITGVVVIELIEDINLSGSSGVVRELFSLLGIMLFFAWVVMLFRKE